MDDHAASPDQAAPARAADDRGARSESLDQADPADVTGRGGRAKSLDHSDAADLTGRGARAKSLNHAAHANSFGPAAEIYERGRPPYPEEALDWLLPAVRPRVLDLGAGTGKLTRQVHARGLEITAVDPSDGMLAELGRVLPAVKALIGSAEAIPVPNNAVDVVLVAQAWHWVDPAQAVPEVARVLSPGGRLGLIWNLRDEREDWVRRLGEIIGLRRAAARSPGRAAIRPGGGAPVSLAPPHRTGRTARPGRVSQLRDPAAAGRAGVGA